jgi:hypothetical protein
MWFYSDQVSTVTDISNAGGAVVQEECYCIRIGLIDPRLLFAWQLNYGQANGWTCHSLRHTFITHLMKVTGNDVGTVMKYSGHKTLESFSNYIHPTDEGRIVSMQALDNVDGILTAQGSVDGVRSDQSVKKRSRKPLQNKQVAV